MPKLSVIVFDFLLTATQTIPQVVGKEMETGID
jgi:hypothetical protein